MSGVHWRHWPGAADRPALALHCMLGSGASWGPIADRLGGCIDLRAPDWPAHGRSAPWSPTKGPDFTTTATRLVGAVIDRPVDLIGHSFGAVVALRLAVAAPHAIRSLTLIEPVLFAALPPADRDPDGLMTRVQAAEAAGDRAASTRAFMAYWGGTDLDAASAGTQAQLQAQMATMLDSVPDLYQDRGRILRDGGIEAIDAPVMLISGAQSPPSIHAIAEALAARLADVGHALVPGAHHMAPLTHPDEVAGLIRVNLDRA